nr:hypothetical protein [Tanacetum cinerariifolium]GEW67713.1 hypothetical protein [Tanacetum cinerariifolium]
MSLFRVFYTPSFSSGWMSFSKRPGKIPRSAIPSPWTLSKTGTTVFLGGRERVFDCFRLAHECSKRRYASRGHIFRRSRENIGYTPHSRPKTTRGATLLSGTKPQILPGGRGVSYIPSSQWLSLIRTLNPIKMKTGSRPRAAHEVPLLTVTANRVIEMEDPTAATDTSGVLITIERSPSDFANEAGDEDQGTMALEVPPPEDVPTRRGAPEAGQTEGVAATGPSVVKESRKKGHDEVDANAPSKVLRKDHADPRPTGSTRKGKSLAAIELGMGSTRSAPVPESAPADVSDPDRYLLLDLSHVIQQTLPSLPRAMLRQGIRCLRMPHLLPWSGLLTDLVDHIAPPGYFSKLRHLHNDDFLRQYNVNLARQVAMGSQLRLRFEQEAKLLKKFVAQVAHQDKRIQAREHEIKNMEALLEAEADMRKAAEDKRAELSQELENMRTLFSDLQVSNDHLSQQVATLQDQVSREEKLKAAFEEFKRYEDNGVEQRCAEMDALSVDFDEELYPHMLTAIACRRWMIGHGLRLAVVKCSKSLELRQAFVDVVLARIAKGMSGGLRHGVEHGQAQLNLEAIEAYDPKAKAKYIAALQALKNLNDTGDDAPQWVRELRPSSSQLTIPVYPEKKKKCRIVCRTHGFGSAHHARSDGVPVSAPTVVPQGLTILLADAATQTKFDEATLNNL